MILLQLLFLLFISTFTGCTHFQPTRINKKFHFATTAQTETPSVAISAQTIFHNNPSPAAHNITKQVTLLSLNITNKTNQPISIDATKITPNILQKEDFARLIPRSYSCYFIPAVAAGSVGFLFLWQIGLSLGSLLTLFGINQSRKAAESTLISIDNQTLKGIQFIAGRSTKTFLLAIDHNQYQPEVLLAIQTQNKIEHCTLKLQKKMYYSYNFT